MKDELIEIIERMERDVADIDAANRVGIGEFLSGPNLEGRIRTATENVFKYIESSAGNGTQIITLIRPTLTELSKSKDGDWALSEAIQLGAMIFGHGIGGRGASVVIRNTREIVDAYMSIKIPLLVRREWVLAYGLLLGFDLGGRLSRELMRAELDAGATIH